jgi:phosphoribosylformylglycinamidine synthase
VREAAEDPAITEARAASLSDITDIPRNAVAATTLELLGAANIGSRKPVYQRYDSTIMTNTVVGPGPSDAAVLRIKGQAGGLAMSLDCNSRYCYLDPYRGAQLAVAEALRNVSCVGGRPLAITNCLNFRNPEKPAGYYQLSKAVAGMANACRALGVAVVSGNVSLYNETSHSAIYPTSTIGCVGVLDDVRNHARMIWREGDQIVLIGGGKPTLGGSEYLAALHHMTIGEPPALNLDVEADVQRVVREAIAAGEVRTAHDVSLGGMAVAIAEMAIHSGIGAVMSAPANDRTDVFWFGERASAILVAVETAQAAAILDRAAAADVPAHMVGTAMGATIAYGPADTLDLAEAAARYEAALVPAAN